MSRAIYPLAGLVVLTTWLLNPGQIGHSVLLATGMIGSGLMLAHVGRSKH